ncbi:50S ribosomal protein L19, chloroplastic [Tetrabaena socialis]|uniref:50S ribosomal protein L19, chloroplastic n=1 Tax=Tetrabaena socialis TaxID=47790 RepID=A0A2J7ZUC9_9CHLO|nr:50S ribosomal protein L19, chloroplastic [Tetrabaena socialis]|eukprot:PNH03872.1 50S ribosomal protein L19, chloroplastic [Tetrabaena socialis]
MSILEALAWRPPQARRRAARQQQPKHPGAPGPAQRHVPTIPEQLKSLHLPAQVLRDLLQLPSHILRDLRPPAQSYQLLPKLAQRPTATPALYTPWTPTRALPRRSHVTRRMGFLVNLLERETMLRTRAARPLPRFGAGDVVEVRLLVPEAERKEVIYRGLCIARYEKGLRSTFKLYNVFPESGGVVQHLPLYMPDLLGIKVVGRVPAKQERLFHLLEKQSSAHTFQTAVTQVKS